MKEGLRGWSTVFLRCWPQHLTWWPRFSSFFSEHIHHSTWPDWNVSAVGSSKILSWCLSPPGFRCQQEVVEQKAAQSPNGNVTLYRWLQLSWIPQLHHDHHFLSTHLFSPLFKQMWWPCAAQWRPPSGQDWPLLSVRSDSSTHPGTRATGAPATCSGTLPPSAAAGGGLPVCVLHGWIDR